jgi:hypothetical protein
VTLLEVLPQASPKPRKTSVRTPVGPYSDCSLPEYNKCPYLHTTQLNNKEQKQEAWENRVILKLGIQILNK